MKEDVHDNANNNSFNTCAARFGRVAYIENESGSRTIAEEFLDRLWHRAEVYAREPSWGELCPHLGKDVRRFICDMYVVLYLPSNSGIRLLRVVHGSRDINAGWLFSQRD
jgi:plasmid stabilization system protein ParE